MTPYQAVISTFAIAGASFGTWASRIPSFKDALQLEPAQLGSILLVLALASIVSFPLAGRIMDLYGAARISKGFTWATRRPCPWHQYLDTDLIGRHLRRHDRCYGCCDEWLGCRGRTPAP